MRGARSSLVLVGLLALGRSALAADLSVTFVEPEKFADAIYSRLGGDQERAQVLRDMEQHLQRLAERHLAANESLRIEVLDIDLAGQFEPFRFRDGSDVRIVRDITWPRIKLRYALTRDQRVVASAEEQVSDMNFLMSVNRYPGADRLRYEKAMLDDWFEKRIGKR